MAAIVPDSIIEENAGSLKLLVLDFETTLIDDGDTYASGLGDSIVAAFSNVSTDEAGGTVNVANSSGALTFYTNGANNGAKVCLLVRG